MKESDSFPLSMFWAYVYLYLFGNESRAKQAKRNEEIKRLGNNKPEVRGRYGGGGPGAPPPGSASDKNANACVNQASF